jgi:hypothetical protein
MQHEIAELRVLLDRFVESLGNPDEIVTRENVLAGWQSCHDPGASTAFINEIQVRLSRKHVGKNEGIALAWLLGELLHDSIDYGKL